MRRKRRRTDASALVAVAALSCAATACGAAVHTARSADRMADLVDSLFTMLGVLAEEAAGLRAQRQEFDIRGDRE
jgi:hypothetical protein